MATQKKTKPAEAKPTTEKPKAPARTSYIKTVAGTEALNAEGRLTVVPSDFDARKHEGLKKADFASEDLYLDFKADQAEARAKDLAEKATELRNQAKTFRQFGDPKKRQQARKLVKMQSALETLQKQLASEGIDVEALLAGAKDKAAEGEAKS